MYRRRIAIAKLLAHDVDVVHEIVIDCGHYLKQTFLDSSEKIQRFRIS